MNPRISLVTKIVLLAVANLVLLAAVFFALVRVQLEDEFESFLMATAREKILAISRQLAIDYAETAPDQRDQLLARYSESNNVDFLLYGGNGEQLAGPKLALPPPVRERFRRPRFRGPNPPSLMTPPFLVVTDNPTQYWVGARFPLRDSPNSFSRATLLLVSPTLLSNPFFFELRPWLIIGVVAIVVSLLCWLPLVHGLTHDIRKMMHATAAITEGRFDVQVTTSRRDELGSLGVLINRMASRLETYITGQKRFLGDVAHELRSPLGRMQVALGILERRASAEDVTYLQLLNEEVNAMSSLTGELLSFAKSEFRPTALELHPVNLLQLVRKAVTVESGDHPIGVDIDPNISVLGDGDYLLRAIGNLIRNAIRYAGDQGPIDITAHAESDRVRLTVADNGPGIPEEALEKVFAPFYRLDPSRDRRSGGTGLGLAIVRSCVEACEGSVQCRNRQPHGLEVTITLKRAKAPPAS